jgi:hypothetical protein
MSPSNSPAMKIFLNRFLLVWVLALACCENSFAQMEPLKHREKHGITNTNSALDGRWHSIKVSPPTNLPKISFRNKINPIWWFGNVDDPTPPDSYRPDDKHRLLKWHWRNPFHNFDFYVVGVADNNFTRSGRYPAGNGNPHGGWNVAVTKYKWTRLPFVSYSRGKFNFYLGWRNRGNFGLKLNYSDKVKKKTVPAEKPAGYFTSPSETNALAASLP